MLHFPISLLLLFFTIIIKPEEKVNFKTNIYIRECIFCRDLKKMTEGQS